MKEMGTLWEPLMITLIEAVLRPWAPRITDCQNSNQE